MYLTKEHWLFGLCRFHYFILSSLSSVWEQLGRLLELTRILILLYHTPVETGSVLTLSSFAEVFSLVLQSLNA